MRDKNNRGGKLDSLGIRPTPGMPHWSKDANDKRHRKTVGVAASKPTQTTPRVTVCPCGTDQRYTVKALPDGYVSQLDPADCRPWAARA